MLQFSSDIPSGQRRQAPQPPGRLRGAEVKRATATAEVGSAARRAPQNIPARTTKLSEKLVLLPETADQGDDAEKADFDTDNDAAPTRDAEEAERGPRALARGKSYAERLPKARRAEKLARLTAYCTAEAFNMRATLAFLKEKHGARTKLYDDCLYAVYHRPLMPGFEGYRVHSGPIVRSPGGKAVLDEAIERSERRDYDEGEFLEPEHDYMGDREGNGDGQGHEQQEEQQQQRRRPDPKNGGGGGANAAASDDAGEGETRRNQRSSDRNRQSPAGHQNQSQNQGPDAGQGLVSVPGYLRPDAQAFAEMFVFSYGVVVFWNFTERQEKDILADLTFSKSETGVSIVSRPQREEDFETEEFHFEYAPPPSAGNGNGNSRPRVFNDMITLRSGDHMIKLAISHAIAQSTKLSFFEERMVHTMGQAQYIPRKLALTGELGLKREEVVRILGRLFKSRVDVNLCT